MNKPKYAIIKTPIVFGTKDINIPEVVIIECEAGDQIWIRGDDEPIKREAIWKICDSKAEAKRIIKKSEEVQGQYEAKLSDIGYDIAVDLEEKLKLLVESK